MTLAYFCLGGLDLLAQREKIVGGEQRTQAINWVYAQQIRACPRLSCGD